jgi:hypothetical protein
VNDVSRKDYPEYFNIIKRPMSFNVISVSRLSSPIILSNGFHLQKRIKRKEYSSPKAFMDEVELVFTNATTYNEDHSQIWEDAKVLQVGMLCFVRGSTQEPCCFRLHSMRYVQIGERSTQIQVPLQCQSSS